VIKIGLPWLCTEQELEGHPSTHSLAAAKALGHRHLSSTSATPLPLLLTKPCKHKQLRTLA